MQRFQYRLIDMNAFQHSQQLLLILGFPKKKLKKTVIFASFNDPITENFHESVEIFEEKLEKNSARCRFDKHFSHFPASYFRK